MKKVAIIAGTRPEIIKLAPVHSALQKSADQRIDLEFITTGQHDQMAQQALSVFSLKPDVSLELMRHGQTPQQFLSTALTSLCEYLTKAQIDLVIVQGDTATSFAAALSAFHLKIPVAHVEAGLRTHQRLSPFPEEVYRSMISRIATLHFCPTSTAVENLTAEGVTEQVHCVGNTVVDALFTVRDQVLAKQLFANKIVEKFLDSVSNAPIVLVTGHRRENHHGPLEILCSALSELARSDSSIQIIFPVHLNPVVHDAVHAQLRGIKNITLVSALDYVSNLVLMERADLIISDSGGMQEEAPYCGSYIIVTRDYTERPEVLTQKYGELHPLQSSESLVAAARSALDRVRENQSERELPQRGQSGPFGDGNSAERIANLIEGHLAK